MEETRLGVKMDENDYEHPVEAFDPKATKGSGYKWVLAIGVVVAAGALIAKKRNLY